MSSCRVSRTRTGRLVFHAPSAAIAAHALACVSLPPNRAAHPQALDRDAMPWHARARAPRPPASRTGAASTSAAPRRRSRPATRGPPASRGRSAPARRCGVRPSHRSALVSIAPMSPRVMRNGPGEVGCPAAIASSMVRIAGSASYSATTRAGAALRGVERLGQHPRDGLVVEHHLARKQRLVVPGRAGVALTRARRRPSAP